MCGAGERVEAPFGRAPELLRPPYGVVNADVRLAAKAAGLEPAALVPHLESAGLVRPARPDRVGPEGVTARGGPSCSRPGRGGGRPGGRC
ncbi:hypothetical protein [Streptomyces sp. NPDC058623]|uniref:hypothetical protein n=1 Tax=Streptomyces sp. NPDC058623 TaxID=3346563 RepID=UPI003668D301